LCNGVQKEIYCLVVIAKVVLIELLKVLLPNAVDDALYTYVGDGLLKVKHLLKILCVRLEAEEFALGSVIVDGWIDQWWLNEAGGQSNGLACDGSIVDVIENQCQLAMESAPCCCFDGGDHLGHFFHHLVHGLGRRLSYDGIDRLCHHDEVDCHVDGQTSSS
jgi:hypothetical protein